MMRGSGRIGQSRERIEFSFEWKNKRRRQDSDDGIRLSIERNGLCENFRTRAKLCPPEAIRQDNRFGAVGEFLLRCEVSSDDWRDLKRVKEVGGYAFRQDLGRLRAAENHGIAARADGCQLKDSIVASPGDEIG